MTEVQSFIRVVHWYRHRGKHPFEFFYANVCNYDISYIYRYRFVINET